MIRNKYYIYASLASFTICVALFFPYPNNHLFDARMTFLFFPIKDGNGFISIGVIGSSLFLVSLALLVLGLKKYYTPAVIILACAYILMPLIVISVIQQTVASGIYSVSYDGAGKCTIEEVDAITVDGECFIKLFNHSNEAVSFRLELIDSFPPEDHAQFESLLNLDGPIYVTLQPKEETTIHIHAKIDISNIYNQIAIGTNHYVHIKIIDGEYERIL